MNRFISDSENESWSSSVANFCTISLIKNTNDNADRGSPCLRPICDGKKWDNLGLTFTQDLTFSYIDCKRFTILLLTLSLISFCHIYFLLTVSNARRKSTKEQYNFSPRLRVFDMIV